MCCRDLAVAGLEMVDVENLRPHYARTLWAWSDALEARLDEAREVLRAATGNSDDAAKVLRAYRLYLAGCAMSFEQGWLGLHQMLATRPDGQLQSGALRGAQSAYPFNREYVYGACSTIQIEGRRRPDHARAQWPARPGNHRQGRGAQGHHPARSRCPARSPRWKRPSRGKKRIRKPWPKRPRPRVRRQPRFDAVSLRQRAVPFLDMLRALPEGRQGNRLGGTLQGRRIRLSRAAAADGRSSPHLQSTFAPEAFTTCAHFLMLRVDQLGEFRGRVAAGDRALREQPFLDRPARSAPWRSPAGCG